MDFAGVNYLAIVLAALLAFVLGGIFYFLLGKQWMNAARIDPKSARMDFRLVSISLAALLVIAFVLAGVIGHLGTGQVTPVNGVISALFVWLGFVAAPMVVNHRFQGFGWRLTFIDGAHWLLVLLAMGLVIGTLGV